MPTRPRYTLGGNNENANLTTKGNCCKFFTLNTLLSYLYGVVKVLSDIKTDTKVVLCYAKQKTEGSEMPSVHQVKLGIPLYSVCDLLGTNLVY